METLDVKAVVMYYTAHPFYENPYDHMIADFVMKNAKQISVRLTNLELPVQRYQHSILVTTILSSLAREQQVLLFDCDFSTIAQQLVTRLREIRG